MGKTIIFTAVFVIICAMQSVANGYRILGVFPSTSRSHYIVGSALMKALAARGHEVSVITQFPGDEHLERFEEIAIPDENEYLKDLHESLQSADNKLFINLFMEMVESGRTSSERVLEQPVVQELLSNTNRTFDLVICEIFITDALFGFSQHYNAPLIGIAPMGYSLTTSILSGTPIPASFVPNQFLGNTDRMNFLQRSKNLAALTIHYLGYYLDWLPYQSKVYNKFFPNAKATLQEVLKNVSLILLNQHASIGNPDPVLHNMIEVGGLHIQRKTNQLPPEIKKFLDEAVHGAIYFSLGTNLKSEHLSQQNLDGILKAFRSLKQRVIWKYENSSLPDKSDNILINDWFSQNDILAHPNVKLFITHGGLLGATEAVYHAKPMLGIPFWCDQFLNMARAVADGYALQVSPAELSKDKFRKTIKELLSNPEYTKRVLEASSRYRDQPMEPLDTAIYWVEYVLRHKGAPHLRSAALELNFFQYHSLDTICFVYGGVFLIVYVLARLLRKLFATIIRFDVKQKLQ